MKIYLSNKNLNSLIVFLCLFFLWPDFVSGADKRGNWTDMTREIDSKGKIQYLYQDKNKNLWFWTDSGLSVYDSNKYHGKYFRNIPANRLAGKKLKRIFEDSKGFLWLLTDGGITRIRIKSKNNSLVFEKPQTISTSKKLNLNSVYEDRKGNIWFWKKENPEYQGFPTSQRSIPINTIKNNILSFYQFNGKGSLDYKEIKFVNRELINNNRELSIRIIGIFENKAGEKIINTSEGYCLYDGKNTCNVDAIKGKLVDENNKDVSQLLYWDEYNHHINSYSYFKDSNNNLWFLVYKKDESELSNYLRGFAPYTPSSLTFSLIKYNGESFKNYSKHHDGLPLLLTFPSLLTPSEEFWPQIEDDNGTVVFPVRGGIFLVNKNGATEKIPWEKGFTTPFISNVISTNTNKHLVVSQNGITLYSYDTYKKGNIFKTLTRKKMSEYKMISEYSSKWKILFDPSGKLIIFEWGFSEQVFGERPEVRAETLKKYEGDFIELFDGIENGILNILTKNIEAPIILDNLYIGHGPFISMWLPAGRYSVLLDNRVQGYDLPCKAIVHEGGTKILQKCIGKSNLSKRFLVNVIPNNKTNLISTANKNKGKIFNLVIKVNTVDKIKGDDFGKNNVSKFFFDRQGYLWFNADKDKKAIRFIGTEMKSFDDKIILFESQTGELFFKDIQDNSISKYNGESFKKLALRDSEIIFLFEDSQGGIWFESNGYLGKIQNNKIKYFSSDDGLSIPKLPFNDNLIPGNEKISKNLKSIRLSSDLKKGRIISSFYENLKTKEIWFGMAGAVTKYDGKKFLKYPLHEELFENNNENILVKYGSFDSSPSVKPGDMVLHITQDNAGKILWFATYDKLFEMEIKTGIIKELNKNAFKDKYITALLHDKNSRVLWIGFSQGIMSYNYDNGAFNTRGFLGIDDVIGIENIDFRKISRSNIFSFQQEKGKSADNQKLWMILDGLIKSKKIDDAPTIANIFQDNRGDIWFLPFEIAFLYRYSKEDKSFESIFRERGDIKLFFEDKLGQIWIANNYNNDIEMFDGENYNIYPNIQGFQKSRIKSIRDDRSGNLWVESDKGISIYIQPQFAEFWIPRMLKKVDHRAETPFFWKKTFESNTILDFQTVLNKGGEYNEVIWTPFGQYMLTMKHGKNFLSFVNLSNFKLIDQTFSTDNISSYVHRLKSNGYFSYTTNHYGIDNILFFRSFSKAMKPTILSAPFRSFNSLHENDQSLFFATQQGAFKYNYGDNKIVNVLKPGFLEDVKNVNVILQDSSGNIWFGTEENGLFLVRNGEIIRKFSHKYGVTIGKILCLYEDHSGNIWVGTDNGLVNFSFNIEGENESKISSLLLNELIGRRINAIFEDKDGFLWIGLADGVIKYNHKFGIHSKIIFMESREEVTAISQVPEGDMWFGFSSGRIISYRPLEVAITAKAIKINGKDFIQPFILKRPLNNISLQLNVPDYSIKSIKISARGEFSKTKLLNPQLFYSLNLIKTDAENSVIIKNASSLGKPVHFDNLSENGNYVLEVNYNNEKVITTSFEIAIPFYLKYIERITFFAFFLLLILGSYLIIISNQAKTEKLTSFALAHTVISSINRTSEFINDLMHNHRNWDPTSTKIFLDKRIDSAYFFANEGRHLVSFILNMPLSSRTYIPFLSQKPYNCWEVKKYTKEIDIQNLLTKYTQHFLDISKNNTKLKKEDESKLIKISEELKNSMFKCNENAFRATVFELLKNAWRYNNFGKGLPVITLERVNNKRLKITITNYLLDNVQKNSLKKDSKRLTTFKGGKNSFGRYLVSKFLKQSSKWDENIEDSKYSVWFEFMATEGDKV